MLWQQERGWVWGDKDWRLKELFAAVIQMSDGVGLIGGGRLQGEEESSSQKRHWGGRAGTPCCPERVGEDRGVAEDDSRAYGVWATGPQWNIEVRGLSCRVVSITELSSSQFRKMCPSRSLHGF